MGTGPEIADPIVPLIDDLERSSGVVAVVLGGSRAIGTADAGSDWDLGVYYRGELDLGPLRRWAEVHPPGRWGRIMNGGAWVPFADPAIGRVDVLLRDLDVVERWSERAEAGEYEVDGLLGYLAGLPTYSLVAERSVARVLRGSLPPPGPFPAALARAAPPRWRFHRDFSIEHARAHARRGDLLGCVGQAARAAVEEAHARLCARGAWALNEKRILEQAGLGGAARIAEGLVANREVLVARVERLVALLAAADR